MIHLKLRTKLLSAFGAALMGMALLAPLGQAAEPAPGYTQFDGCPTTAEAPGVGICFRSDISGGHFQMGSKTVPISEPITLSGGYNESLEFVTSPKGGLTPSKQEIPGGIVGLTGLDWLVNFLSLEGLKVYAVTELAGAPGYVLEEPFRLPIKVRLVNPVLGNNCYVGSNANPIRLNLGVGPTNPPPPNEPISGVTPDLKFGEDGILTMRDAVFVDNEFAAPGATGCELNLLGFLPISLDSLVNTQSGLPSPAGTNETVQNVDAEVVETSFVYP